LHERTYECGEGGKLAKGTVIDVRASRARNVRAAGG